MPVFISVQWDEMVLGGRRWRAAVSGWGVRRAMLVASVGGCRYLVVGTPIATSFSSRGHVTGMPYLSISLGSSATTVFLFAYKTGSAMTFRRTSSMKSMCDSHYMLPYRRSCRHYPTGTHESQELKSLASGYAHMPSLGRTRMRNFDDDTRGASVIDAYKV